MLKSSELTTEVKQKISEIDYKNQNVDTKIKQEKLLLETDKNHLESIKNECMSFKTEENHLKGLLIESKKKLNQVIEGNKKLFHTCTYIYTGCSVMDSHTSNNHWRVIKLIRLKQFIMLG